MKCRFVCLMPNCKQKVLFISQHLWNILFILFSASQYKFMKTRVPVNARCQEKKEKQKNFVVNSVSSGFVRNVEMLSDLRDRYLSESNVRKLIVNYGNDISDVTIAYFDLLICEVGKHSRNRAQKLLCRRNLRGFRYRVS